MIFRHGAVNHLPFAFRPVNGSSPLGDAYFVRKLRPASQRRHDRRVNRIDFTTKPRDLRLVFRRHRLAPSRAVPQTPS